MWAYSVPLGDYLHTRESPTHCGSILVASRSPSIPITPLLKPSLGGPLSAHLTCPGTSLHACSRRRGGGGSAAQSHGPHTRQACAPPCYERPLPPGALAERLPAHAGLFLAPPPRDPFAHPVRDVCQPIGARHLGEWLNAIGSTYIRTPGFGWIALYSCALLRLSRLLA